MRLRAMILISTRVRALITTGILKGDSSTERALEQAQRYPTKREIYTRVKYSRMIRVLTLKEVRGVLGE